MYDAVIGRWTGVDPYGQFYSSYLGMGNNPVNGVDPDGGFFDDIFVDTKNNTTRVVETNGADRLWVDGEYLGYTGGADGSWRNMGFENVSFFQDYSFFHQDVYGPRLLDENFFAKAYNSASSLEHQNALFQARQRENGANYLAAAGISVGLPAAIIGGGEILGAINYATNSGGLYGAIYQQASRKQLLNLFRRQLRIEKGVESIPRAIQQLHKIKLPGAIQKPWHMVVRGREIRLNPFNPLWKLF